MQSIFLVKNLFDENIKKLGIRSWLVESLCLFGVWWGTQVGENENMWQITEQGEFIDIKTDLSFLESRRWHHTRNNATTHQFHILILKYKKEIENEKFPCIRENCISSLRFKGGNTIISHAHYIKLHLRQVHTEAQNERNRVHNVQNSSIHKKYKIWNTRSRRRKSSFYAEAENSFWNMIV